MNRVLRQPSIAEATPLIGAMFEPRPAGGEGPESQAVAEAYAAGREEGLRLGQDSAVGVADNLRSALTESLTSARSELRALQEEAAVASLDTVLEIVEFVAGRALAQDKQAIVERIHRALEELDDPELTIFASPDDRHLVDEAFGSLRHIAVELEPSLATGEARISGRWASADLTRQAALQVVREALE